MSPKASKYDEMAERVTAAIIEALEAGVANPQGFRTPWARSVTGGFALNPVTGKTYRGGNQLWLGFLGFEAGYTTSCWAGFQQWKSVGGSVRKGEKGTMGVYWAPATRKDVDETTGEEQRVSTGRLVPRVFFVFNADQVDGIDWAKCKVDPTVPLVAPGERLPELDDLLQAQPWEVRFGGDQASFNPVADRVQIPEFEAFESVTAFYSTWAHESTHATGHKTRLAREGIMDFDHFGSERYAKEELIAEIGSAFFLAGHGLQPQDGVRQDHLDYIANWLTALRNDSKLILKAANAAQRAVDLIDPPAAEENPTSVETTDPSKEEAAA